MNVKSLLLLLSLIITGCTVTEEVPSSMAGPQMVAMSSVHDLPLAVSGDARFSLDPMYYQIRPQRFYENQEDAYDWVMGILTREFEGQGYRYNDGEVIDSEFYFGYLLVNDAILSDDEYNKIFKINPGLKSQANYSKGTLLVYVLNPKNEFVWRGALQGFQDESIDEEIRMQRAQNLIHKLMQQFYSGLK